MGFSGRHIASRYLSQVDNREVGEAGIAEVGIPLARLAGASREFSLADAAIETGPGRRSGCTALAFPVAMAGKYVSGFQEAGHFQGDLASFIAANG